MNFVLERVNASGVRVGQIFRKREGVSIVLDTPLCLSHTRTGFVPYLTSDIVEKLPNRPAAALLSANTMYVSSVRSLGKVSFPASQNGN